MCTDYEAKRERFFASRKMRVGIDDLERVYRLHPAMGEHVFPDSPALIVRSIAGVLTPEIARWGFPPTQAGSYVVNVRHTEKPFWRPWLAPAQRCVVPFSAFAEWSSEAPKTKRWFGSADDDVLWFAGVWRTWLGERGPKSRPESGQHRLFAFLTTEPNALVGAHHRKAMPVILRDHEIDVWLSAPVQIALELQRALPNEALKVLPVG